MNGFKTSLCLSSLLIIFVSCADEKKITNSLKPGAGNGSGGDGAKTTGSTEPGREKPASTPTTTVAQSCPSAIEETSSHPTSVVSVMPKGETAPVGNSGDAADDTAFWIDPTDAAKSVIVGTDKKGALKVYDVGGAEMQSLPVGDVNNVDMRYGFQLGGQSVDIFAATHRASSSLYVWKIDPSTRKLTQVGTIATGLSNIYGFGMYKSKASGQIYAFVNTESGAVRQFKLTDNGGSVAGQNVRDFSVGSQTEGIVADDELGHLYVGEEAVGIWKYGAEPGAGSTRTQVDKTASGGHVKADVEGLTIYYSGPGIGYLMASSQGDSTYAVYRREGANAYVGSFSIGTNGGVDGATGTDGIDVINAPMGPNYPYGMFVAQDTTNTGGNQNFKLVPFENIAKGLGLRASASYNVRTGEYGCK